MTDKGALEKQKFSDELKQIADHYGLESQILKLVEECGEFTQAAMKLQIIQNNPTKKSMDGLSRAIENFYEELADLSLVCEQVVYLSDKYGEIDFIKQNKIQRTLQLIKGE